MTSEHVASKATCYRQVEGGRRRERALENDLEAERSKRVAEQEKQEELAAALHKVKAEQADAGARRSCQ